MVSGMGTAPDHRPHPQSRRLLIPVSHLVTVLTARGYTSVTAASLVRDIAEEMRSDLAQVNSSFTDFLDDVIAAAADLVISSHPSHIDRKGQEHADRGSSSTGSAE